MPWGRSPSMNPSLNTYPLTFWGSKTVSRFRKPAISLYFGTIRYSGLCARYQQGQNLMTAWSDEMLLP